MPDQKICLLKSAFIAVTWSIVAAISGCASIPPLIQKHNGQYGLYLPTGKTLVDAMLYQQDAQFAIPGGEKCILEHNTLSGKVRFLYPNGGYMQMHGWRNIHYMSSVPLSGGQIASFFSGTVNGYHKTEMMVIFLKNGIRYIPVNAGPFLFGVANVTKSHILFKQGGFSSDPLYRVYNIQQGTLSPAVLQSTIQQQEAAIRAEKKAQQEERIAREQQLQDQEAQAERHDQEALARQRREQWLAEQRRVVAQQQAPQRARAQDIVHTIVIQGGAMPVQSAVPMGHQSVAPQTVNLQ